VDRACICPSVKKRTKREKLPFSERRPEVWGAASEKNCHRMFSKKKRRFGGHQAETWGIGFYRNNSSSRNQRQKRIRHGPINWLAGVRSEKNKARNQGRKTVGKRRKLEPEEFRQTNLFKGSISPILMTQTTVKSRRFKTWNLKKLGAITPIKAFIIP